MKIIKSMFFFMLLCSAVQLSAREKDEDIYSKRISDIKSSIPLTYNEEVKKYIEEYLLDRDGQTSRMIGYAQHYFPMIEKILKESKLPEDLKYVAVAASGLNTTQVSQHGASGIWQLMYNTATLYQLKINSYVDERRDPVKATYAAAHHLQEMHKIYKDWQHTIAAFSSAPLNVNKAIRNAGGSMKYWDAHVYLPEETRYLMPKFIAATYILNYYKEHRLSPSLPVVFQGPDSVTIDKWLSFQQISSTLDIEVQHLRILNPIFKKDIIPFAPVPYVILIPKGKGSQFYKLQDTVYIQVSKPKDFSPIAVETADTTGKTEVEKNVAAGTPAAPVRLLYTVKSGDVLGNIADWYDVTVTDIKRWNKMKSNSLIIGKKLVVYVPAKKADKYRRINTMTAQQKKALKAKD